MVDESVSAPRVLPVALRIKDNPHPETVVATDDAVADLVDAVRASYQNTNFIPASSSGPSSTWT